MGTLKPPVKAQPPFDTAAVANYVLELAERDGIQLSPMKLQKILYFSHGWHLALTDNPLLDEPVEAWQWGPVIPSIYHEFKRFGQSPIDGRFRRPVRRASGGLRFSEPMLNANDDEALTAMSVIDRVWEVYKGYSAIQLSNMTHLPDTPWDKTWKKMGEIKRRSVDINDDEIKKHFAAKMK